MRLPLLIGQAPGPNTRPELPLFPVPSTSAGGRLAQIAGMDRGHYIQAFDRINLLQTFPGKHKRDDKFPLRLAKVAAAALRPLLHDRVVVLVGRNVASAFELELPFHDWADPGLGFCQKVAVIPHPSGRNKWYNLPENRAIAANFWSQLVLEHVPEKSLLPSVVSRSMENIRLMQARQELTNDECDIPGHPVH